MEIEQRLRLLLLQGLRATATPTSAFLKELSAHLRAFLRRRLAQRPDEVEDLAGNPARRTTSATPTGPTCR